MNYVFIDLSKGECPGARVGSGVVGRRQAGISGGGAASHTCKESGGTAAARRMNTNKANNGLLPFLFQISPSSSLPTHSKRISISRTPTPSIPACIISTHEHHDQCLFFATQPSHHPTSQLRFCSLIFVDYVLIIYIYQMAFSPICSAVYALGFVRFISRCYAVP